MHREAYEFVKTVKAQAPEFFTSKKVLEVGSQDINGSVRDFFTDCHYTGIDLGEGKGVDVVAHVIDYHRLNDNEYDVIISTEALEHDHLWKESLLTMFRLLRPGGVLILTVAGPNRPEHGTRRTEPHASPHTTDYYRNLSTEDFASVLPANLWSQSYLGYRGQMEDLYFVGIKASSVSFSDCTFEVNEQAIEEYHQMLDRNYRVTNEEIEQVFKNAREFVAQNKFTVTAEVCTKDRHTTTLPACLSAIIHQTVKPQWIAIYNDGELKDMETVEPFQSLLRMANDLGINWTVFTTEKKGQVACHQHALDNASTDTIWRVDDDEIPEPNCLENLLVEMKDGVGAVGGLVHHPSGVVPLPDWIDGSLNDVTMGVNLQWYSWGPNDDAEP